ncbi:MAG: ABC transporter ATP-binding protein [Lacunisphaera sp.]
MALSSPASLLVRDLTKRYGVVEAVRGVSFAIAPGEIYGLVGPNGAGKTSIIETILGLRPPDSGAVTLNGVDALAHPTRTRREIGAQLQFAALQDKLTPREALNCFAAFYENAAPVDELLEQFSLTAKAAASFDSLSGGQKQRLFLALAMVNRPQLLVLDEPTAGLDPKSRRELHEQIRRLKADGHSVLICTHYLDEAQLLCDRIGILHEGRIVATGSPEELIAGSMAKTRLTFRTRKPMDAVDVGALSEVLDQSVHDDGWRVSTADANHTISALVQKLAAEGNEMLDLQIQRPSLEDVFLELTKTSWSELP